MLWTNIQKKSLACTSIKTNSNFIYHIYLWWLIHTNNCLMRYITHLWTFLFQKLAPKKVSPRKFYWKTLFPSGTASEENAEVLYSTKLVLINSENAPTIDEFNKGGILMDFKRVNTCSNHCICKTSRDKLSAINSLIFNN